MMGLQSGGMVLREFVERVILAVEILGKRDLEARTVDGDVVQTTTIGPNGGLAGAIGTARNQSHRGEANAHLSQDLEVLYAGGDAGLGGDSIECDFAKRSVNAVAGIHIIAVGGGGDWSMGDIFVVLFCLHIALVGTARNRQCTAALHVQQYLLGTANVNGYSGGVAAKNVASGVKFGFSH